MGSQSCLLQCEKGKPEFRLAATVACCTFSETRVWANEEPAFYGHPNHHIAPTLWSSPAGGEPTGSDAAGSNGDLARNSKLYSVSTFLKFSKVGYYHKTFFLFFLFFLIIVKKMLKIKDKELKRIKHEVLSEFIRNLMDFLDEKTLERQIDFFALFYVKMSHLSCLLFLLQKMRKSCEKGKIF